MQDTRKLDQLVNQFYDGIKRYLKRINSHLTAVAYPILDDAGQLRSRLRRKKPQNDSIIQLDDTAKPSTSS